MADVINGDRRRWSVGKIVAVVGGVVTILATLIGGFTALSNQIATQTEDKVRKQMQIEKDIELERAARQSLEALVAMRMQGLTEEQKKLREEMVDRFRTLERKIDRIQ